MYYSVRGAINGIMRAWAADRGNGMHPFLGIADLWYREGIRRHSRQSTDCIQINANYSSFTLVAVAVVGIGSAAAASGQRVCKLFGTQS